MGCLLSGGPLGGEAPAPEEDLILDNAISVQSFDGRSRELKGKIKDYQEIKAGIATGLDAHELIEERKAKILKALNASASDWDNYKWQLKNAFSDVNELRPILDLPKDKAEEIGTVAARYRFSVSPYFLSLVEPSNSDCPIKKQCLPSIEELRENGELDPMNEEGTSSFDGMMTRRYPDRVIINITNICGMYCRHCQRKRLIGERDRSVSKSNIKRAIEYVSENREIREVLITGGDSLLVSDSQIDWILSELRRIKHVEVIRFGTRAPVTLPQRITKSLVSIIKKHHPVYVNTHFNHPMEITRESKRACAMLADAGVPLGNQMVLLKGINNDKFVVRKLNQQLLAVRARPYYIFHPKRVKSTSHFWVSIQEGMEIMESLRGFTTGMAVPYYVLNAPKGLGKVPLIPNYLISTSKEKSVFRNWEGKVFEIEGA